MSTDIAFMSFKSGQDVATHNREVARTDHFARRSYNEPPFCCLLLMPKHASAPTTNIANCRFAKDGGKKNTRRKAAKQIERKAECQTYTQ